MFGKKKTHIIHSADETKGLCCVFLILNILVFLKILSYAKKRFLTFNLNCCCCLVLVVLCWVWILMWLETPIIKKIQVIKNHSKYTYIHASTIKDIIYWNFSHKTRKIISLVRI